ncbi:MAG: hypothetical protein ACE5FJ_02560 [Gemmatimonadales bacterium]
MLVLLVASPATAQIPDARVVPKGVLSVSFAPEYKNYDSRFALNSAVVPDGKEEPLGADFTVAALGANLIHTLRAPTEALRTFLADSTFNYDLGALTTDLDADIRRFPFDFQLGLTDRLTVRATIPIITTRVNSFVTLDSTNATAGWNPASLASGAGGVTAIQNLMISLATAVGFVESQIAAGAYGCPTAPTCADAVAALFRARALSATVAVVTGVETMGVTGELPPAVPLSTSPAGQVLLAELAAVESQFAALGAPPFLGGLPLPSGRLAADNLDQILVNSEFGYSAFPLATTKLSRLGDIELGVRYQIASGDALRALVFSTVRLPTGTLDSPRHFLDISTGDRQTDIVAGIETVYAAPSNIGFAATASYTLQLSSSRSMRVTRPDQPLAVAADEFSVNRDLGEIFQFSFHPWLRLGEGVRAYTSVSYYHKGSDVWSAANGLPTLSLATAEDLGLESSNTSWSFGGGLSYRSTRSGRDRPELPIEAGLSYLSVFSGSGGLTPKFNRLNLYLRLYYRIFGGR